MQTVDLMPVGQLKRKGFEALVKELGAANALRFLSLYEEGSGDYTKERGTWLGSMTIEQISQEILQLREKGEL